MCSQKHPKFDFAAFRASIAVTTINSFLEFCQGRSIVFPVLAQNQEEYQKHYSELVKRYEKAK